MKCPKCGFNEDCDVCSNCGFILNQKIKKWSSLSEYEKNKYLLNYELQLKNNKSSAAFLIIKIIGSVIILLFLYFMMIFGYDGLFLFIIGMIIFPLFFAIVEILPLIKRISNKLSKNRENLDFNSYLSNNGIEYDEELSANFVDNSESKDLYHSYIKDNVLCKRYSKLVIVLSFACVLFIFLYLMYCLKDSIDVYFRNIVTYSFGLIFIITISLYVRKYWLLHKIGEDFIKYINANNILVNDSEENIKNTVKKYLKEDNKDILYYICCFIKKI